MAVVTKLNVPSVLRHKNHGIPPACSVNAVFTVMNSRVFAVDNGPLVEARINPAELPIRVSDPKVKRVMSAAPVTS